MRQQLPHDPAVLESRAEKIDELAIELDVIEVRLRGYGLLDTTGRPSYGSYTNSGNSYGTQSREFAEKLRTFAEAIRKHRAEGPPKCINTNCIGIWVETFFDFTVSWTHKCQYSLEGVSR